MKQYRKLLLVAGAGFLLSSNALLAAERSPSDIINNAYKYIGSMDKYAFKAAITNTNADGKKLNQKVCVKVDRPDKLRVDSKGDIKDRTIYLNNGLFTLIDHEFNYYGQLKTPRTIDATLDFIFDKYGIKAPLAALVYSDMYKRAHYNNIKYFGTKNVNGTECDYVAFRSGDLEIHIWISTGDKPLVKSFAVIDRSSDTPYRRDTSLTWDTKPGFSDSVFVFKVPKGASKISIEPAN